MFDHWNRMDRHDDPREHVAKLVFFKEGAVAEAVLYRYPDYAVRTVVCCSVQSGCPVGCVFCGTGRGFVRSLSVDEIVSQVDAALHETGVSAEGIRRLQIMLMSMGEPLLNPATCDSLRIMHGRWPNAELLVSTIAPRVSFDRIIETSVAIDRIGLQFSIHATTDEKRNLLIPFGKKLNLREIAEVGMSWHKATGRPPFFNFIARAESSEADADRLASLFDPGIWRATVSVLCGTDGRARSSADADGASDFANLLAARGFSCGVFNPAGQDTIGGGCGQLWHFQKWIANQNMERRNG